MVNIWTSIIKRKWMLQFLVTILFVGIIVGVIFYTKQGDFNKNSITSSMNLFLENFSGNKINNLITHLLVTIIILVLGVLIIGTPLAIIYLFYEGLTIGFSLAVFYSTYKFSGIVFGLIFNRILKIIYINLLILFVIKIIDITRNIIGSLIYKKDSNIKKYLYQNLKTALILIIIILINDIALYYLGSKVMKIFLFLIR